ncbi:MAG: helix-turn-helix transcriptional regulator [bacterium]|nr:helix-turn-helix transcriptional regulator [bacterium]
MSDPNTLGSLVRKRRLESGYSLGQLASKVGKTAAEVRSWERDAEMPEHGIIDRLASTLEIDLGEIQKRLDEGKKALETERKAAAAALAAEAGEKTKAAPERPVELPDVEDVVAETDDEDLPGFAVDDPFTPPPPLDDEQEPADESAAASEDGATGSDSEETSDEDEATDMADDPDLDLLDAPTEAVPVPVITKTAAAARAGRAAAVLEEPPPPPLPAIEPAPDSDPGLLRYLEPLRLLFDPSSRYLYWIRAGLTVVVMLVFAVIFFDNLGKLLDAFGELLDTIEPTVAEPDEFDALLSWTGIV